MTQRPRVSVIVPAHNYAQFLDEALNSLVAQTLTAWECIVVDDGSTDATPDLARAWAARDARFRLIRQENRGPNAARNRGLSEATGDSVQFLDADDRLASPKLASQSAFLDGHPDVDIVYGPSTFFRTEEPDKVLYSLFGHLSRPLWPEVSSGREAREKLQMFNILPILAALVRRSVFDRVGTLNESLRTNEDWEFWLRCAFAGCEFRYDGAPASLAFIRTHPESASRSGERLMEGLIDAARAWRDEEVPAVYEMAKGVSEARDGHRYRGARRIAAAAGRARDILFRLRWMLFAAAAALLPRRAFWWFVTRPAPERALEFARKLRRR